MNCLKYLAWIACWLALVCPEIGAETKYVSEIRKITLRTGPGTEYKISAIIPSGRALEILQANEEWTMVRISDGKEGWVLSQFLQADIPSSLALAQLQAKYQAAVEKKSNLETENARLKEQESSLESELSTTRDALAQLETDHKKLKKESANFITLQNQYKAASELLAKTKERADKFEKDYTILYNDKRIKWVLVGIGVLLLGFIIGYSAKPQRRRTSLR